MRHEVGPAVYILHPILGQGEIVAGQQWYHSKERW